MMAWVAKLEASLADAHRTIDQHREDLAWLRQVISRTNPKYTTGPSVGAMISDLIRLDAATTAPHTMGGAMPPDQIVQLFPGADLPLAPLENLTHVSGIWEPPPMPQVIAHGSMLVCKPQAASVNDTPLLFAMRMAIPEPEADGADEVLVAWWVPPLASAATFKAGRKKKVVDLFGSWQHSEKMTLNEAKDVNMPSPVAKTSDVLEASVINDHARDTLNAKGCILSMSHSYISNAYASYNV